MAPPSYYELGYQARDIFNKHYRKEFTLKLALKGKHSDGNIKCNQILTVKNNLGFVKLDVRTITSSGLEFNVHGSSNSETNKTFANVDASYTLNKCGLTLKKKLDSDNNITVELSHRDKLIKGLTLGGRRSIVLNGSQRGTIFAKCRGNLVNLSTDVDFDPAGAMVNGTAVIGSKEFLIGSQVTYDPNLRKMIKTNFAAGYGTHDYAVHGSLNEKYDFNGSIYNKVNESLESAVSVGWSADNSSTKLALGCVYQLDSTSTVRAKINNNSQFSLGFSHILRPGIVISLSSMFDLKNLNGGGHKIGMGIELNQT